jgi:hypothetical protein
LLKYPTRRLNEDRIMNDAVEIVVVPADFRKCYSFATYNWGYESMRFSFYMYEYSDRNIPFVNTIGQHPSLLPSVIACKTFFVLLYIPSIFHVEFSFRIRQILAILYFYSTVLITSKFVGTFCSGTL